MKYEITIILKIKKEMENEFYNLQIADDHRCIRMGNKVGLLYRYIEEFSVMMPSACVFAFFSFSAKFL